MITMQCLLQTNATFALDISIYSFSQVKVMPANNVACAWPVKLSIDGHFMTCYCAMCSLDVILSAVLTMKCSLV